MRLASILLDTDPPRRGVIELRRGHLWCDGNDLTEDDSVRLTRTEAIRDIDDMYGHDGAEVWHLRWLTGAAALAR